MLCVSRQSVLRGLAPLKCLILITKWFGMLAHPKSLFYVHCVMIFAARRMQSKQAPTSFKRDAEVCGV